jgi:phosphate:Na+ symporter
VQSSSATTLATIGFVSAGLLTFPQAVGVIFGANLGTTSTGWLVSLIGLRVQMGALAYPMVALGVLMRLAGRGWVAPLGFAVAGFGLLFLGIDVLQSGMRDLAARLDPAHLPGATMGGQIALVGIGAAMTVVMQSSSAALATTLAALDSGTIGLTQGAALVIGQNAGTTVKAALAAIGASIPARRTAVAHILFNVITSVVALALLPLLLSALHRLDDAGGAATLAAFHTVFNLLGVMILFPFIDRFAALVERMVPEHDTLLTRHLDATVRTVPAVAIEAAQRTLREVLASAAALARRMLQRGWLEAREQRQLQASEQALAVTRQFLLDVRPSSDSAPERRRHLAAFHAVDHLDRLVAAALDRAGRGGRARPSVQSAGRYLDSLLAATIDWLDHPGETAPEPAVARASAALTDLRQQHRHALLERMAAGGVDADTAAAELDAMHWMERVGYHAWRAVHHLGGHEENVGERLDAVRLEPEGPAHPSPS